MDLSKLNEYQTQVTEELLSQYHEEVVSDFYDYVNNVPFIQNLIKADRPYAKDLPRDDKGRIIVDIVRPHILTNMDYFREPALFYQKHGKYTNLKVDVRPNSPFMRWLTREWERCWYGMVRPEDGEWVTGDMYFYLNYFPIIQTRVSKDGKIGERVIDFPEVWEGVYLRFHYWEQARFGGLYNDFKGGNHAAEVSSRTKSKSYCSASKALKLFLLGVSREHKNKVKSVLVANIKEYLEKDGILNKYDDALEFLSIHSFFPKTLSKESWTDYTWIMKKSENMTLGIPIAGDSSKVRGKRCDFLLYEEFGSFGNFIDTFQTGIPNVEEGDVAFGFACAIGTGGDKNSNFYGALEFINNPKGYNVYAVPNLYDKGSSGKRHTLFYFPTFLNSKPYYNKDGVSDVVKAMLEELEKRRNLKYNSSDLNALPKRKAEYSFTLKEALMKKEGMTYDASACQDRVSYLDNNPEETSGMMAGELSIVNGKVILDPTADVTIIKEFPHKDNKLRGGISIVTPPVRDKSGEVPSGRYIAGADVFDDDGSDTLSLFSIFILDLYTDDIVAEYTGREDFADDSYEKARLLLLYYNAECNYENNKKGFFTYMSKHHCVYLLSPTLQFLKDKDMVKEGYGNKAYGTIATEGTKRYGRRCYRDYLNSPVEQTFVNEETKEITEVSVRRILTLKHRALLLETSMWNSDGNFDRHDAIIMLMLLREDKLRLYEGDVQGGNEEEVEDDFFKNNYKGNTSDSFSIPAKFEYMERYNIQKRVNGVYEPSSRI